MRIDISREARADIDAAADWYIEQSAYSAALGFCRRSQSCVANSRAIPHMGVQGAGDTRMRTLQYFPYTLVYRVMPDHVKIIAAAHHSRRPGFWRGALGLIRSGAPT
jgi:plasmid stabilization system protein ParE